MSTDALHTAIPLPLLTYTASADKFRSFKTQSSTSQGASLIAQLVKNLPALWETWVRSLGWEDPLENGKASHSSILAWRIPWTI